MAALPQDRSGAALAGFCLSVLFIVDIAAHKKIRLTSLQALLLLVALADLNRGPKDYESDQWNITEHIRKLKRNKYN